MTDESSVISGANVTDHHIAMIRDDGAIQTEIHTCKTTAILASIAKLNSSQDLLVNKFFPSVEKN